MAPAAHSAPTPTKATFDPNGPSVESTNATDIGASPGLDYLTLKAQAESQLNNKLTDSHGVRYRDVRTVLSTMDGAGIVAFCGDENSKTPEGGYGGYQRFIASQSVAITEDNMTADDFGLAWRKFCTGVAGPTVWL